MVDRKSWVLWNYICRYIREGPSQLESVWVLRQTQLAVTESAPLGQQPTEASGWVTPWPRNRRSAKWVLEDNSTSWSSEEDIMGQYNSLSLHPSVCLSVCLSLSLSPSLSLSLPLSLSPELWFYKRIKRHIFLSPRFVVLPSLWVYNSHTSNHWVAYRWMPRRQGPQLPAPPPLLWPPEDARSRRNAVLDLWKWKQI